MLPVIICWSARDSSPTTSGWAWLTHVLKTVFSTTFPGLTIGP